VISVWIEQARGRWFAVAHHDGRLVATATGTAPDRAASSARSSLPRGCEFQPDEEGSDRVREIVQLLARLEDGEIEAPAFDLCPDCLSEPLARVARVASAIPRGYVATYGGIAAAAGTDARVVGQIMATNPLYPIIPCHRVVGADLSLVGYTGSQASTALRAKLDRLRAEARGYTRPSTVSAVSASAPSTSAAAPPADLAVYPAEWVIAKANSDGLDAGVQLSLWARPQHPAAQ
jgi:methylated-DNA-[protein]-cysteine S-methyltransferase